MALCSYFHRRAMGYFESLIESMANPFLCGSHLVDSEDTFDFTFGIGFRVIV